MCSLDDSLEPEDCFSWVGVPAHRHFREVRAKRVVACSPAREAVGGEGDVGRKGTQHSAAHREAHSTTAQQHNSTERGEGREDSARARERERAQSGCQAAGMRLAGRWVSTSTREMDKQRQAGRQAGRQTHPSRENQSANLLCRWHSAAVVAWRWQAHHRAEAHPRACTCTTHQSL